MAAILRWSQTWNGSLVWTQTWSQGGPFLIDPQGPIALGGALGLTGDLVYAQPVVFTVEPQGPISLAGTLAASGAIALRITWEPTQPLDFTPMSGTLGLTGNLVFGLPRSFVVDPQGPIALGGALGLTGDLVYAQPVVFTVEPQGPISLAGTLGAAASLTVGTRFTLDPSPIALAGSLGITGDIAIAGPAVFTVDAQAPISLVGSLGVSGDIAVTLATSFVVEPQAPISLGGSLALTGDLAYAQPVVFSIDPQSAIGLVGSLAASAGLDIRKVFSVEPQAPVALAGSLALSGDLTYSQPVPFLIEPIGPIAMAGQLQINAALAYGAPVELVVDGAVALVGSLGVSAALNFSIPTTVPDVVGLTRDAAILAIETARLTVYVLEATSPDVPAGSVINQSPAGGEPAFVGDVVYITVSTGNLALDPKLIARRKKNPNITFKRPGKREEPVAAKPVQKKAAASPLLLGLMARGLAMPTPPMLPEPAPALDVASIAEAVLLEALPAAIEEPKPEVPPTPEQLLQARVEQLEQQVMQMQADLAVLRQPVMPAQASARDPVLEALHAIVPAIADPIDIDAVPEEPEAPEEPAAAAPAPAQPAGMTREEIEAENERRARLAAERLL